MTSGELTSRRWIVAKGVLFAGLAVLAGGLVLLEEEPGPRLAFLLVCVWASCRFYSFLFYVLERYVGVEGRYAGLLDLGQRLWTRRRS